MEDLSEGIALLKGELFANPEFLRMLGWAATGADASADAACGPGSRGLADIKAILQSGAARFETTGVAKDGTQSRIEVSITAVPSDGPAYLVCVRDVTDRKKAESDRAVLEARLQRSVEGFGAFAGKLSHDVGNSLMALMGYASLLKSSTGDDKLKRYADLIINASETAAGFVRTFGDAGAEAASFAPLDLNDAAMGAAKTLLAGGGRMSVKLAGERLVVSADAAQLTEAIVCLAGDLQDTPGKTQLRIETGIAAAPADGQGSESAERAWGMLSISYTGEGAGASPAQAGRADAAMRLSAAYATLRRHRCRIAFSGAECAFISRSR